MVVLVVKHLKIGKSKQSSTHLDAQRALSTGSSETSTPTKVVAKDIELMMVEGQKRQFGKASSPKSLASIRLSSHCLTLASKPRPLG